MSMLIKKPPVGNGGAWIGTRLRQNSLVRRRRLEKPTRTSTPYDADTCIWTLRNWLARRVFESTLRRGSWIARFRSFFILSTKPSRGTENPSRGTDKTNKGLRRRAPALQPTGSMNCNQHRMEESLGQGAAQFFTYFLRISFYPLR